MVPDKASDLGGQLPALLGVVAMPLRRFHMASCIAERPSRPSTTLEQRSCIWATRSFRNGVHSAKAQHGVGRHPAGWRGIEVIRAIFTVLPSVLRVLLAAVSFATPRRIDAELSVLGRVEENEHCLERNLLVKWLTDTESLAPDNDRSFRVPNPDERRGVIAYLKSLTH